MTVSDSCLLLRVGCLVRYEGAWTLCSSNAYSFSLFSPLLFLFLCFLSSASSQEGLCSLYLFSLILYHCLLETQSNGSSNLQKCNQFTRLLLFSLSSTTTKSTWVELFAQPVLVFIALLPSCSLCTHVFQSVFYPSCYNLQLLQKKLLQIGARFSWQEKGEIGMAKGFYDT